MCHAHFGGNVIAGQVGHTRFSTAAPLRICYENANTRFCLHTFSLFAQRTTMSLAERRRKAKAIEEAGAALSVKLVARSTRGQRISELQGEDAEAHDTFWGQGAWQEAEDGDSEFSSEEGEIV